jgi:hypothetical protein
MWQIIDTSKKSLENHKISQLDVILVAANYIAIVFSSATYKKVKSYYVTLRVALCIEDFHHIM